MNARMAMTKVVLVVILGALSACQLFQESVPVKCSRRESRVGNGYVIEVKNQSDKTLSLWIETAENKKHFNLGPYESEEFGWLEGFHFGDNTSYSVGGESYAPLTF